MEISPFATEIPKKLCTREREGKMTKKHLSPIANRLLERCAEILDTSIDALVEEFESGLYPEPENYSRKLVEFCSSKALCILCCQISELITDVSFSRFTYDMMLAWECPSSSTEECYSEIVAKEKEDKKDSLVGKEGQILDDIPLFYSDAMPLLVDGERSVGADAFVWLASQLPLVADYVNAEFSFEALTAPTAYRLYYPAYDRFLKEVDKCIKHLQKQPPPKGVELADDEVILHVEGTPKTQRVIRHIKTTTWPGKLTLTNRALYFEASGVISYEDAVKIDLSASPFDVEVKPASTGPFGAPLYDKAIVCKTPQQSEYVVLEFPELTSSTRRDHWLTLIKEIVLLHQFLSKYKLESPIQSWEMQARTILCIIRLHAAREMLRISPPVPQNFLIFSLFEELPKGDYVLEELSNSLKKITGIHPCSATSMVKNLNISHQPLPSLEDKEGFEVQSSPQPDNLGSLDTTISQVREETKEVRMAKATVEELKEEGVTDSLLVLAELLSPLKGVWSFIQEILSWERPVLTSIVLVVTLVIIYKEWVGYALAAILLCGVGMMMWARMERIGDRYSEVMVSTSSDQTTLESIVEAQHSLIRLRNMVPTMNIAILKIQSIVTSRAPKHVNQVMLVMTVAAIFFMVIPFKFVLVALTLYCFMSNLMASKTKTNGQDVNRRLREWWDSIPVVPVRVVS